MSFQIGDRNLRQVEPYIAYFKRARRIHAIHTENTSSLHVEYTYSVS